MSVEKWHGYDGYTNHGCRCDICRDANAQYHWDLRHFKAERLEKDPTLAPHGINNTYANWRCRCRPCTDAHSAYERARLRRAA